MIFVILLLALFVMPLTFYEDLFYDILSSIYDLEYKEIAEIKDKLMKLIMIMEFVIIILYTFVLVR